MALKTYRGSCDCGKVKFEVDLDLSAGTFKCNCKICWKLRFWGAATTSDKFRLLSGESDLTKYGVTKIHHFCRHCGTKLFGRPLEGPRMVVSLPSLDNATPEELAAAPIRYYDGLHDNWKEAPSFTAHL